MKYITLIIAFFSIFLTQCSSFSKKPESPVVSVSESWSPTIQFYTDQKTENKTELPVITFEEIWAYVVAGREAALTSSLPLTDIGYFGAEIDSYGKLTDVPKRSNLNQNYRGRIHLVVSCNGRALSYFTLRQGSRERSDLITDLLSETRNFDGLQINFENIPARSGEAYLSFLRELREGLPQNKMLTVALAARTRKIADDVYDYEKILPIVDRILVMGYDEHWSGSRPGSVASIDWCRRVAEYSVRTIGRDKLIMGLPFYGRAWGDYGPSRALVHSSIADLINEHSAQVYYDNGIPTFIYNRNVSVRVYYDDEQSLTSRMQMYKSMNVRSVGFWRLGQETQEIWKYLRAGK